jgi:hypothetical protein
VGSARPPRLIALASAITAKPRSNAIPGADPDGALAVTAQPLAGGPTVTGSTHRPVVPQACPAGQSRFDVHAIVGKTRRFTP